jgi:repressor LexA
MDELTLRQQEVLGFLRLYMREQGTWPSFREIEAHFGFKSTNAVMGHLKALERKGYISRVPGQARTFRIVVDLTEESRPAEAFDVVDIPVYGSIAAGFAETMEPGAEVGRIQIDARSAGIRRSRRCFALRVRGESMIDAGIFDGDTVVVEQSLPSDGDIVAALIDGETTLKRFVCKSGHAPYLKAENRLFPALFPVAELVVQGVVKALVRQL